MAKAATPAQAPAPEAPADDLPELETVNSIPETLRGIGASKGPSPFMELMKRMAAPSPPNKAGQRNYVSFFLAADEPAETITDEKERKKALKENAAKLVNRLTSVARRIVKADKNYKFAFRTLNKVQGDETTPFGVRVYRVDA